MLLATRQGHLTTTQTSTSVTLCLHTGFVWYVWMGVDPAHQGRESHSSKDSLWISSIEHDAHQQT